MVAAMNRPREFRSTSRPASNQIRSTSEETSNIQQDLDQSQQVLRRSRKLTFCLVCLIASVCCLSPFYLSTHLTQRVGLLLFESDLVQLRSSLFSLLICTSILVILMIFTYVRAILQGSRKVTVIIQKILKQSISLFSILSAVSYLSIALMVPQIKQIQRMPLATFDCNANLITIENCRQQFSSKGREQNIFEAFDQLLTGDLNANNERLIKRLNCLKYNDKESAALEVPTRFLLHNCGLVCKPQRQQLHQFSDDLNSRDQTWQTNTKSDYSSASATEQTSSRGRLVPPYDHEDLDAEHLLASSSARTSSDSDNSEASNQVSLRVCFSSEFSSGSNYKKFCITNLVGNRRNNRQSMTVGQLNAMLRKLMPLQSSPNSELDLNSQLNSPTPADVRQSGGVEDQTTHFANPVVQFESHFKNWPHLTRPFSHSINNDHIHDDNSAFWNGNESEQRWCKFTPIPPFIVNNKPFSDIQCALEHEYTMTTGSSTQHTARGADKIYLKKSASDQVDSGEQVRVERCNIQCKVNILYQVHLASSVAIRSSEGGTILASSGKSSQSASRATTSLDKDLHYYLPLKPCVIVSGDGDKLRTSNHYLLFRSLGDSALLLTFILLDLFLLLEAADTKQAQFEAKKFRVLSLLIVIVFLPLIKALIFDLSSNANHSSASRKEAYLSILYNERIVPYLNDLFSWNADSNWKSSMHEQLKRNSTNLDPIKPLIPLVIDNYMLIFFFYSVFMFMLAMTALWIPLIHNPAPLIRVSSVEELGLSNTDLSIISGNGKKRTDKGKAQEGTKQQVDDSETKSVAGRSDKLLKMISFVALTLFMGLQFSLSQVTQTQPLIEAFGQPERHSSDKTNSYSTSWFTMGTSSTAAIFVLLLSSVFIEETCTFCARFSPFNQLASRKDTNNTIRRNLKRNEANLLQYLAISLIIYSARYYALSILNPNSRLKWLIIFLFQLAEIFNFPLVWFSLTTWAHQMASKSHWMIEKSREGDNRSLLVHLTIQAILALVYFALGRFVALFVHSAHASLHLHSDNIDWFITSFYQQTNAEANKTRARNSFMSDQDTGQFQDSVFTPLPGERQTYLHATGIFLHYNSVLCLMLGILLCFNAIYLKYQIWFDGKRSKDSDSQRESSSSIDQRLSLDLMRIHSGGGNRMIYPRSKKTEKGENQDRNSPRAKILFHYNLDKNNSIDASTSSDENETVTKSPQRVSANEPETQPKRSKDIRIPIAVDQHEEQTERNATVGFSNAKKAVDESRLDDDGFVERVVMQKSKKVRIFEDDESWFEKNPASLDLQSDEPVESSKSRNVSKVADRGRIITFSPTVELIDGYGHSGAAKIIPVSQESTRAKRASPEPSIEDEDSDSIG